MKKITDKALNARLAALDGGGYTVHGLEDTGKCIPYVGWFWRNVDFSRPVHLYMPSEPGFDVPQFIGFMENNKWGYRTFACTQEQTDSIKALLVLAVSSPSDALFQAVFDYMQKLKP